MRIFCALLLTGFALANAQMQQVGGAGSIDWGNRVVVVTGIGAPPPNVGVGQKRPMAERAAWADAMRKALETIKGINIDAATTIQGSMVSDDVVSTKIQGYIRSFQQQGRKKYFDDQTVEITYEVTIGRDLIETVLPAAVGEKPSVTVLPSVGAPKTVFTGLIVDCRGLSITPAIAPRILDDTEKEVYGAAFVTRDWAAKHGLAGYVKTVEDAAKLTDRVGANPGVVKAVKASGANKTDVAISKKDADSIRSAAENLKFLSECRVVFVVD